MNCPKTRGLGDLSAPSPSGGGAATDWTGVAGVLGASGTVFSLGDYTDAFTVSGLGVQLDALNTTGSGATVRAQLTGAYGGFTIEAKGAVDFMVAARVRIEDATNGTTGVFSAGRRIAIGLTVCDNAATLGPYQMFGTKRDGVAFASSQYNRFSNASWGAYSLSADKFSNGDQSFDLDIAVSQSGGFLTWWVGHNGSWIVASRVAHVAIAGTIALRMHGNVATPWAAHLVNYAPIGVFAASETVPPRLAIDP